MDRPTCQGNLLYMVLPNASEHCDVCTTVPGIMKQESRCKCMAHTTTLTNSSNTQALSIHVASEPLKARTYYIAYSQHHTIPLSTLLSPLLELASSCVNYILGKHLDKTIPALVFIKSCTYPSHPCTLQVKLSIRSFPTSSSSLQEHGVDSTTHRWIRSFLSGKTQYVAVGGRLSNIIRFYSIVILYFAAVNQMMTT